MADEKPINRSDYKVFYPITTRWMDNDMFGHVNNVTYYSYFDTAVNQYIIEHTNEDIHNSSAARFVVHSNCNYLASISYPDEIEVGIRVNKLGNSSVTYGVSIFKKGEDVAAAIGEFVHVFVDSTNNKPTAIPQNIRTAYEKILI